MTVSEFDSCPSGCNLLGAEFVDGEGVRRGTSRLIGVAIRGVYDGTAYFMCPDCGMRWHRFPPGSPIAQRVDEAVSVPVRHRSHPTIDGSLAT